MSSIRNWSADEWRYAGLPGAQPISETSTGLPPMCSEIVNTVGETTVVPDPQECNRWYWDPSVPPPGDFPLSWDSSRGVGDNVNLTFKYIPEGRATVDGTEVRDLTFRIMKNGWPIGYLKFLNVPSLSSASCDWYAPWLQEDNGRNHRPGALRPSDQPDSPSGHLTSAQAAHLPSILVWKNPQGRPTEVGYEYREYQDTSGLLAVPMTPDRSPNCRLAPENARTRPALLQRHTTGSYELGSRDGHRVFRCTVSVPARDRPLAQLLVDLAMSNTFLPETKSPGGPGPVPTSSPTPPGGPANVSTQESQMTKPSVNERLTQALKNGAKIAAVNKAEDKVVEALLSRLEPVLPISLQNAAGREGTKALAAFVALHFLDSGLLPTGQLKHRDKIVELLKITIEGASGAASHELLDVLQEALSFAPEVQSLMGLQETAAQEVEIEARILERELA